MTSPSTGRFAAPDLLGLGQPPKLATMDFEALFAMSRDYFVRLMTEAGLPYDVQMLETDPAMMVAQSGSYRDMLRRKMLDDLVAQSYLGSATGAYLDHRAADYGVLRRSLPHTIAEPAPANRPSPVPPKWTWDAATSLWREDDESLRTRARLAWEALSVAGPRGAYLFHAAEAHPMVDGERSAVYGPETGFVQPGEVLIIVQSYGETGLPAAAVIDSVAARVDAAVVTYSTGASLVRQVRDEQTIRPLGARVIVRSAQSMPFHVVGKIFLRPGPDPEAIRLTSLARLNAYLEKRRSVGTEVPRSGLIAAIHIAGSDGLPIADEVELDWPPADVVPQYDQIASVTSVTIAAEVR